MNLTDLIDRLTRHKTIGAAPREELAWLAGQSSLQHPRQGDIIIPKGVPAAGMYVLLSGHMEAWFERETGRYKVFEWAAGDVAGLLPFSRFTSAPGDAVVSEDSEMLFLATEQLPSLIHECPQITALLVGTMIDRARAFHTLELREARNEADKANRAKSDFLARMSHEIRTPLNAIIGMADVLAGAALTPHERKCVEISQKNGIGLLHLINDLLDLAKVESGKVELEAIDFHLHEVISGALDVLAHRTSDKGLWLRQKIDSPVPVHLIGDPNRLRQILINLLGNSIKFTGTGGVEIRVELDPEHPEPGQLRFAISDTGIGIEPDKLDAVFESFTQADVSTTRKYGGTGLGLAISKQLVELMGGRIWLESIPGAGTTFFFTASFQVQESGVEWKEEKLQTSVGQSVEQPAKQIAGIRLLVADDSEDNRFLVEAYLKGIPCSIDNAENGAAAVELFKRRPYDLVLMDGEMPIMDGCAATREIRRFESERGLPQESTPILAFTAHAHADMTARALDAGCNGVLTKPIRRVTLLEALAKYRRVKDASEQGPEAAHIRVQVDPDLRDVAPGYLEKRRADILTCEKALAAGDLDSIRAIAHKMKGTGAGYGFPFLTETGAKLEIAAREGRTDEVRDGLAELASWLANVELMPEPL